MQRRKNKFGPHIPEPDIPQIATQEIWMDMGWAHIDPATGQVVVDEVVFSTKPGFKNPVPEDFDFSDDPYDYEEWDDEDDDEA